MLHLSTSEAPGWRGARREHAGEHVTAPPDPVRALALRRSVPDFLARRLAGELGLPRADRLLGTLNEPPRLDLRANRLRTGRGELASQLAAEGVATSPCALSPDGLIAADRAHLFGRAHAQGLFEVQDEGSQLIALATGASAGEIVIDFCAGSGGKALALALAGLVGPGGRVVACDPAGHRLARVRSRARRADAAARWIFAGGFARRSSRGSRRGSSRS
jgi:16S rRNA (cytosine967-C5)-methyltransferase